MNYKLGSLFDGSGGFPFAGALCGVEPVWAAEIEPYPIAVTKSRFPKMKHLGDISKVNGGEIEPVDIITFGSPCQDLSVAGKRAGLKHEANGDEETTRSGLFMEAVRIIKEMRNATNGKYPSFALWENVPGAFSSNKGEDFRIVLEELIKIVEPSASMPQIPSNGWAYADSYIGDGWSLAYRVFDAQYWGVPQRRRRIHLVLDLRGQRAREILFEREGLRGYFEKGGTPWQTITEDAQGCIGTDDSKGDFNGGLTYAVDQGAGKSSCSVSEESSPTLACTHGGAPAVVYTLKVRSGCDVDANGKSAGKGALVQTDKAATLSTVQDQYLFQPIKDTHIIDNIGGQAEYGKASIVNGTLRAGCQGAVAYEWHNQDTRITGPIHTAYTLNTNAGGREGHLVLEPFCKSSRAKSADDATTWKEGKVANTLNTFDQGETRANELVVEDRPVICLQGNGIDRADTAGCNGKGWNDETCYTLNTIDRPAVAYGIDRAAYKQGQNAKYDFSVLEEQQPTMVARGPGAVTYQKVTGPLMANSHPGSYTGQDAYSDMLVTCVADHPTPKIDEHGKAYTLNARDYKAPLAVAQNYIVRRLTPTECARLQGFPDRWGDVKSFDPDEWKFWADVRNTLAAINGKKVQNYTAKQMETWYNKLHTDSAEYKMWGNGIALPPALYVLQGMVESMKKGGIENV